MIVTKLGAAIIALLLVLMALGLSFVMLWGIAKQMAAVRDKAHIASLRTNARQLEAAGYLEAAEQFRAYARAMEVPQEKDREPRATP